MKLTKNNNRKVAWWLLAAMLAVYAGIAFVSWNLNPREWSYFGRFFFVGLEAYGALGAIKMAVEYYTEQENND